MLRVSFLFFFFFNDTATTEIYTLSLHDALPISQRLKRWAPDYQWAANAITVGVMGLGTLGAAAAQALRALGFRVVGWRDRKSTRLNSSHVEISYAVFCLKKKKNIKTN